MGNLSKLPLGMKVCSWFKIIMGAFFSPVVVSLVIVVAFFFLCFVGYYKYIEHSKCCDQLILKAKLVAMVGRDQADVSSLSNMAIVEDDNESESPWGKAYAALFDASRIPTMGMGEMIPAILLNFLLWLVGGGVIFAYILDKNERIEKCDYRLTDPICPWLEHVLSLPHKFCMKCFPYPDYAIILGWNSSAFSFAEYAKNKLRCRFVIVLTMADPQLVRTVLDDLDAKTSRPFGSIVYHCEYDDKSELEELSGGGQNHLKCVYILGEEHVSPHDSHVIRNDSRMLKCAKECGIASDKIFCDIHDFGLYHVLQKGGVDHEFDHGSQEKDVKYRNFYTSWAACVCSTMGDLENRVLCVIGFGAMGEAVALSALKEHCSEIFVTDWDDGKGDAAAKLEQDLRRFGKQFPNEVRHIRKVSWEKFIELVAVKQECRDSAQTYVRLNKIVVAKRHPEKGLGAFTAIMNDAGGHYCEECPQIDEEKLKKYLMDLSGNCYLNQEIEGPVYKNDENSDALPKLDVGLQFRKTTGVKMVCTVPLKVTLFGLRRGARWLK